MDNIALDANNNRAQFCPNNQTTSNDHYEDVKCKIIVENEKQTCNAVSMSSQANINNTPTSCCVGTSSTITSHVSQDKQTTKDCFTATSTIDQTFILPFDGPSSSVSYEKSTSISFDFIDSDKMKLPIVRSSSGNINDSLSGMNSNTFWSKNWNSYQNCTPGSNDSSYDSDQDSKRNSCSDLKQFVIDLVDSGTSTTPEDETQNYSFSNNNSVESSTVLGHEEINRTNSETLGQEYREYVTHRLMLPDSECSNFTKIVHSNEGDCSEDENDQQFDMTLLEDALNLASYQENLNYALKLGYSKKHLQRTLLKLGFDVEKNELLEELIRISDLDETCSKGTFKLNSSAQDFNHVQRTLSRSNSLRPIVIDGSNVAISHGNKEYFSCKGIAIVVQWFRSRGHHEITAFVPHWRKQNQFRHDIPVKDREILEQLENERVLVFTPSRTVAGKLLACYDDRYILNLALKNNGIIVSNDNYRDLIAESAEYSKLIKERVLMYSFVNDEFMPPDDPLGRNGPRLNAFLRFNHCGDAKYQQLCPYDKKCTYGIKCKYFHPERDPTASHKPLAEQISENAKRSWSKGKASLKSMNSLPLPAQSSMESNDSGTTSHKKSLFRTKSIVMDIPLSNNCSKNLVNSNQKNTVLPVQQEKKHKKLERQLTLLPGFDPRLSQLQNCTSSRMSNCKGQMSNKQMLAQTKSCSGLGGGVFNSFDLSNISTINLSSSQPNRQYSHSTRNLDTEPFVTGLNFIQQQQRNTYLNFQQQQQQMKQQQQQQQHQQEQHNTSHPCQNRLVKSLSLSSPSQTVCSTTTAIVTTTTGHNNANYHSTNGHFSKHFGGITNLLDIERVSMPSVTITAETPVSSNVTFDVFDVSQSNHQFSTVRSKQPLQQSHSFSSISASVSNTIRSNPTGHCSSSNTIQSQLYPNFSTCSYSSQSLPPFGLNNNSNNVRKGSGVCSPVMPIHQTVSRNLSAPETLPQTNNQINCHQIRNNQPVSQSSNHSLVNTPIMMSNMTLNNTDWSSYNAAYSSGDNNTTVNNTSLGIHSGQSFDDHRSRIMFHLSSLLELLDPK